MRLALNSYQLEVLFRSLLAIIGGFVFSLLLSLLISFILPIEKMHAVAWSTMLFFVVLPAVVMWSFGIANYKSGALYLVSSVLILSGLCWLFAPVGVFS